MLFATLEGTGTAPSPRRGHCANSLYGSKLLIFGGQAATGEVYGDTYMFDLGLPRIIQSS